MTLGERAKTWLNQNIVAFFIIMMTSQAIISRNCWLIVFLNQNNGDENSRLTSGSMFVIKLFYQPVNAFDYFLFNVQWSIPAYSILKKWVMQHSLKHIADRCLNISDAIRQPLIPLKKQFIWKKNSNFNFKTSCFLTLINCTIPIDIQDFFIVISLFSFNLCQHCNVTKLFKASRFHSLSTFAGISSVAWVPKDLK